MAKYLLDTNVVLRLVNSSDTKHNIVVEAILANNIDRLLTFNPKDFKKIQKIIVIKPQEILKEDN